MHLAVIDGSSLLFRAFYAMPPLTAPDGSPTGAVFGFFNMFFKLIDDYAPDHLAVALDRSAPTFRHEQYQAYKAGRKEMPEELSPQFDLLERTLQTLRVPVLAVEGYEADDILGTLSRQAEIAGGQALLVTGDRDALQLISEKTNVLLTRKGLSEVVRYDPAKLMEDFGFTPDQMIDYRGLMGDSSDNIPGVPGVGEKTAGKLIREYKNLEGVYEHLSKIGGKLRERLEAGRESAFFSRSLSRIDRDVPHGATLEMCRLDLAADGEAFRLFQSLGFKNLLSRVRLKQQAADESAAAYEEMGDYRAFLKRAEGCGLLALHRDGDILSLSTAGALCAVDMNPELGRDGLPEGEVFAALRPLLEDEKVFKVLHDAKEWMHALDSFGIKMNALRFDVMIAAYLLDAAKPRYDFAFLCGEAGCPANASSLIEMEKRMDAELRREGMSSLFFDVEMRLIGVLYDMERIGFALDAGALSALGEEFGARIVTLTDSIYAQAGEAFNIQSPKQLGEILFDRLGLPHGKKTKTGYSTDVKVLETLAPAHPIVADILSYRHLSKLKSTYVDAFAGLLDGRGRVHSRFNQTGTVTGRLSSSEPNLQNIPVRTPLGREIRRVFHSGGPDRVLVDADYSQIELRVLAHVSRDPTLIGAFLRGEDIHRLTAAKILGVAPDEVTGEMRSRAKAVNFGIVYGISDFGLAQQTGISRKQAADFIEKYFQTYPGVRAYMDACVREAEEKGCVRTLLGRRRSVEGIHSSNFNTRSFAQRVAMNTPIQGTAADIIKLAMIGVSRALEEGGFEARLILQVHDELIVEAPEREAEEAARLVKRVMEGAMKLSVPLTADVAIGRSWYDTK